MEKNEIVVSDTTGEIIENNVNAVALELTVKRDLVSNGRKFDAYEIKLVLPIYRDGKLIGEGIRRVPFKFSEHAFEDRNSTSWKSEKDAQTGVLLVDIEGLSPIYAYYEKTIEKNGKKIYVQDVNPKTNKKQSVYVNFGMLGFKKYTTARSAFDLAGYREKKALEAQVIEEDSLPSESAAVENN